MEAVQLLQQVVGSLGMSGIQVQYPRALLVRGLLKAAEGIASIAEGQLLSNGSGDTGSRCGGAIYNYYIYEDIVVL